MRKNKSFAFTLAEVLITLAIIGVVAAITLPSLIQKHQEKEFATRTKKLYSDIGNALILAQKNFDVVGDNSLLFNTTDSSYEVAKKLGQYFNGAKVCKDKNEKGCSKYYYEIKYATLRLDADNKGKVRYAPWDPVIILSNGAIISLNNSKRENCYANVTSNKTDEYGRPVLNPDGSNQTVNWTSYSCGLLNVDVNGVGKPNQYGRDVYQFSISKEKLRLQENAHEGGKSLKNIIYGNGKLEYKNYNKGQDYSE